MQGNYTFLKILRGKITNDYEKDSFFYPGFNLLIFLII